MPPQALSAGADFSYPPFLVGFVGLLVWHLMERLIHQVLRLRQPKSPARERLSWYLCLAFAYGAIVFSLFDAIRFHWTLLSIGLSPIQYAGIPLVVAGIIVRAVSRVTLGRQFSGHVQTTEHHQLVTSGIYRTIRHPAYLGYLCLMLGFPLCFGSVGGLAIAVVAGAPSLLYRTRVEEASLRKWFGDEYDRYMHQTWRLLPLVW
jgi:protein-S-isoprenylcysteine O-methyltransferase Ste14